MLKKLFLPTCFFFSLTLSAQDVPSELPALKANDFFLQFGSFSESGTYSTLNDFHHLAPGSQLLKMDLTGFDQYYENWYGSPFISALVGFRLRNREGTAFRKSPLLKAGVTFARTTPFQLSYTEETKTRIDTVYSQPAGMTLYADSVNYKTMYMDYNSDQLRFDFSAIFRTNPEARWSIYGGAGISLGWSFNNYTNITYSEHDYVILESNDQSDNQYSYSDNGEHNYVTENTRNKNGFNGSFYVPLGIDFKIARRGEFFSRLHLFYEFRPGINYFTAPELGGTTRSFIGNSFGLRINWQD